MKLTDLYKGKFCPLASSSYRCENIKCAKFISCMVEEIDALYAMDGINEEEADDLDRELIKLARNESLL